MKKIIVPTDFSKASENAFQYAYDMAKDLNASIKLVHVSAGNLNPNQPILLQPNKGRSDVIKEQLNEMVENLKNNANGNVLTKVPIKYEEINGFTVGQIIKEAKKEKADMIIMGTTGSHDILEKAIGSISTGVAQRAECPVLLIPKDSTYQTYENILFACDYEAAREDILMRNIAFANIFRAAMHFVHVSKRDEKEYAKVEDAIFESLFQDGDPAFSFNLVTLPNGSIRKALFQYASENRIDLIVLVNQHESFLDNVLAKSLTKEMGLYTKFPLLVYQR